MDAGTASVFHGGPSGIGAVADSVIGGGAAEDNFGSALSGVGDLDRDGFDDVAVASPYADPSGRAAAGLVTVFRGSAFGLLATPATVIPGGASGDFFGSSIAAVRPRWPSSGPLHGAPRARRRDRSIVPPVTCGAPVRGTRAVAERIVGRFSTVR
jgi:hypothetical protein